MADELEAQDRQRKELVANVSHELRTPIAGLRAVLENVVDGVSAADPETMRTALKQTERLGRLVETLLDLSRLDNGVVPLRPRRFEVWPYLSGVLKEAKMVASARAGIASGSGNHTRTDVHLHLDVSPAGADRARGRGAAPPGRRQPDRQRGQAQPAARPGHGAGPGAARTPESLDLEVLDEGPGIPESEWHRVFERFNRGAVSSPARPRQRRRHGPGPGDRPLGGGSARRPHRSGRIVPRLPDPGHPSGDPLGTQVARRFEPEARVLRVCGERRPE